MSKTEEQAPDTPTSEAAQPDTELTFEQLKELYPAIQAEVDKRDTAQRKSLEKKYAAEAVKLAEAAKAEERKRAEEAKLVEDGKLQELADVKTKEAEEAKAKLAAIEHGLQVDALLDKKSEEWALLKEPAMRALIKKASGELSEIDALVDNAKGVISDLIEQGVTTQLGTNPPPTKTKEPGAKKKFGDMTMKEWAEEKARLGIQ